MPSATKADAAFWDASGIVLLTVNQPSTRAARALQRAVPRVVVWWGTRVEARSAVARMVRTAAMSRPDATRSLARLRALWANVAEVLPSDAVRDRAELLLDAYDLRAGDALQLGAALDWCSDRPKKRVLVCFDRRFAVAARDLGFDVRP